MEEINLPPLGVLLLGTTIPDRADIYLVALSKLFLFLVFLFFDKQMPSEDELILLLLLHS